MTRGCKIAEYAAGSKTCCTSAIATKKACKGSFVSSKTWKGYVVCGAPKATTKKAPTLPGTSLKCGADAGPICMGYNIRCFRTSLAGCKSTCKKTAGCKIAEYSTGGTCCTSAIATKKECKGSFVKSSSWKGYVVCGAPKKVATLPGCIAGCKADKKKGCKIAEYSTGKTCCTSAIATKKTCKGSFVTSKTWKGYVVC